MMFLLTAMSMLAASELSSPDDWPAFLGAEASEVDAKSLPLKWTPDSPQWSAKLPGQGQSSPIVWNGTVYATTIEGANKEKSHVVALDLATGKEKWRHSLTTSFPVKVSFLVSQAAPTPAADSAGVIAFFEAGDLIALTHEGKVRWQRSLSKEFGEFKNRFGLAGSVAQDEKAVYILVDHEGPSYVMAVAKKDGKTLWKQDREGRVSWASPTLIRVGDSHQLIVSSSGSVDAYDPGSGKLLWSKSDLGGNTVCTPIDAGDGRILIGASAGERQQYAELAPKSNVALRITGDEGDSAVQTLWTAPRGALASFASPIIHGDCAYWVTRAGVVYCLDANTGEQHYAERIAESCWATPLGVGDRIYFFGRSGKTSVLAAGPEFRMLATNELWKSEPRPQGRGGAFAGRTLYGSAAVNGRLLLREGDQIHCLVPQP